MLLQRRRRVNEKGRWEDGGERERRMPSSFASLRLGLASFIPRLSLSDSHPPAMQRAVASVFCQCGSSSSSSSTTSLARVAARTFHSKPPPTSSSRLAPYSWASPRSSTSLPPPQQTHPFSTSSRIRQQVDATTTTSTTTTTTTAASTSPSLKTSSSESSSAPYRSSSNPRFSNSRHQNEYYAKRNRSLLLYTSAVLVLGVGVTYAAVPLYRAFCQGERESSFTSRREGIAGCDALGRERGKRNR